MAYKNVFLCDAVEDLPELAHGDTVAILVSDLSSAYLVEGGVWVRKNLGTNLERSWPLDSVFCIASEKEPADLLGFGEWELIKKAPVFMWRRIG